MCQNLILVLCLREDHLFEVGSLIALKQLTFYDFYKVSRYKPYSAIISDFFFSLCLSVFRKSGHYWGGLSFCQYRRTSFFHVHVHKFWEFTEQSVSKEGSPEDFESFRISLSLRKKKFGTHIKWENECTFSCLIRMCWCGSKGWDACLLSPGTCHDMSHVLKK